MSYAIGWIDEDAVYLSADTLLSSSGDINFGTQKSATGEDLQSVINGSVNDSYLKIWIIKDMAVAFVSNNSIEASRFLSDLEWCYDSNDRLNSIESLLFSYNPTDSAFLFAFYEDGPKLYRYDQDYDELIFEEFPTQIGSLPGNFSETTFMICEHVIEEESDRSPDDKLVLINSVHQQILLQHNSISHGVGGVFTGLYIDSTGIHWQKDTIIFDYNYDRLKIKKDLSNLKQCIAPKTMTIVIPRNPFVFTHSGFDTDTSRSNHLFKFCKQHNPPGLLKRHHDERKNWMIKYRVVFEKIVQCPKADYIVFYSAQPKNPPNLHIVRCYIENPWVAISCLDNSYYNIDINYGLFEGFGVSHDKRIYNYEFVEAAKKRNPLVNYLITLYSLFVRNILSKNHF